MKVAVDSNIVFSAILNTDGKIGQLLLLSGNKFEFYSISDLKTEILRYKSKILAITNYSEQEFSLIYGEVIKQIFFVNTSLISNEVIRDAREATADVDINDTMFVALASHLKSKLWSGDKKLKEGLSKKGLDVVISTEDLYQIFLHNK